MNEEIKHLENGDFEVQTKKQELYNICSEELGHDPSDQELIQWLFNYAIKLRENYDKIEFMLTQKLIS